MYIKKLLCWAVSVITLSLSIHANTQKLEKKNIQKELNVALVLWRGETKAEHAFKSRLEKLDYKVKYTVYDAENKRYKFPDIVRGINFTKFDYVYTFGTSASYMVKRLLKDKVPQIFNIVSSPILANIVKSTEENGGNIAGVSNQVSLETQINAALGVFKIKRLGLFFNPREHNSMIIYSKLIQLGIKYNFEVVPLRSPIKRMLNENLYKLTSNTLSVDAVYLPADSFIVSNAKLIGQKLREAKIKSIGAIKEYVEKGALIGTVTDYKKLGQMAANILDKHQKGTPLNHIPVQMQKKPILVLNKTTCDLLNIVINKEIIKSAVLIK